MADNVLGALRKALAARPVCVGFVVQVSVGRVTIQTPDGGLYTAIGTATLGQRVFFNADGAVLGDAQMGDFVDIEV